MTRQLPCAVDRARTTQSVMGSCASQDFENFLESFIRQRYNTESRLRKLHLILFVGRQAGTTPREEDILNMIYNTST